MPRPATPSLPHTLRRLPAALLAAGLALATPAAAQHAALNGIDAVSLRDSGRAVGGRPDIVTHWRGASWHFANETNRQTFESNPRAYAPAMGGLCAVSLADGRKEPGDPAQFVVVGQRIYLTRDAAARAAMRADPEGIVARATDAWKRLGR
ncbi:YHS domain-containing (seleno)protein [Paracoccus luteus]|uniref:YHS domain-containing (seleno)protein n=1 Tax=Paracoccus luteus TaxID=2508543 RepID=UPI001FE2F5EC|nr:YHS domain-containing (seleno)protein [Paracoccus luteus]